MNGRRGRVHLSTAGARGSGQGWVLGVTKALVWD